MSLVTSGAHDEDRFSRVYQNIYSGTDERCVYVDINSIIVRTKLVLARQVGFETGCGTISRVLANFARYTLSEFRLRQTAAGVPVKSYHPDNLAGVRGGWWGG